MNERVRGWTLKTLKMGCLSIRGDCRAAMDEKGDVCEYVSTNHAKHRHFLLSQALQKPYRNGFIHGPTIT